MAVDTVVADPINTQPQDWASRLIAMQKNFEGTQDSYTDPAKATALAKANMDIGNEFSQNAQRGAQLNLAQKAEAYHEQNSDSFLALAKRRQDMEDMLFPARVSQLNAQTALMQTQLTGAQIGANEATLGAQDKMGIQQALAGDPTLLTDPVALQKAEPPEGVRPLSWQQFKQGAFQQMKGAVIQNTALAGQEADATFLANANTAFSPPPPDYQGTPLHYYIDQNKDISSHALSNQYNQLTDDQKQALNLFDNSGKLTAPDAVVYDRYGNIRPAIAQQVSSLVNSNIKTREYLARGAAGALEARKNEIDSMEESGDITHEEAIRRKLDLTSGSRPGFLSNQDRISITQYNRLSEQEKSLTQQYEKAAAVRSTDPGYLSQLQGRIDDVRAQKSKVRFSNQGQQTQDNAPQSAPSAAANPAASWAASITGTAPTPQSQPARVPNQKAIDHLKSNPTTRDQFDQYYGTGSAAKILGS